VSRRSPLNVGHAWASARAEVGVPELALDDVERAFAGELDGVRVA
jgi:hypothetical protein